MRERAASQQTSTTFHADLGDTPPPQWATDIDQAIIRGSRFLDEVVFFHRQSQTGNELVDRALQHYGQNEHYPAWRESRAEHWGD